MDGVLHDLDLYYDEEDRVFDKIRASVRYPSALLCIMTVVLAFMVGGILPVFVDAYQNMSGSLTTGSFGSVQLSILIGWIALFITLVCTIVVLVASLACGSTSGRERLMHTLEHLSFSKDAMYQLALSRFTMALATNVSSSVDDEDALQRAIDIVDHDALREKLDRAHGMMVNMESPRSLTQALDECDVFEPLYARMLRIGAHTGDLDAVLERLSGVFFDDASEKLDQIIDKIEPFLAAFLTVAVAASLVSVMLPLIGIMRTIG
jgi:type IV pilus assembly protein PilC